MSAHPESDPHEDDHPELAAANARAGLWLFGVYLALYGGFVGLNAFDPAMMGKAPFGGLNLAVIYGFGLIVMALVLALVYMGLCRRIVARHRGEGRGR